VVPSSCPGIPELSHSLNLSSVDIDQNQVLNCVHHPWAGAGWQTGMSVKRLFLVLGFIALAGVLAHWFS
jgi:hypothetical protein